MRTALGTRARVTLASLVVLLGTVLVPLGTPSAPAVAGTPLTVAQAVATQDGSTATVRGYVVGEPTATNTVVTSGYPDDYALALADSASETSTAKMVYVQVPAALRSSYGLRSNPGLKGQQLDVTGQLTAYFSHPGLKNGTAFAKTGGTGGGGTGGSSPYDSTYYASAMGLSGAALKSRLH